MKRGGKHEFVLLDEELEAVEAGWISDPAGTVLDEDQEYERRWAAALVTRAISHLEAQFSQRSKALLFSELRRFITGGGGLPSQEEVAQRPYR